MSRGVSHRWLAAVTSQNNNVMCCVQGVLPHMAACYPGLLMQAELRFLHKACNSPQR
jgi:hypothetical protein